MLKRKIAELIEQHLKSGSERILLIDGARHVGKTYIIRHVGKKLFPNFIEINMLEDSVGDSVITLEVPRLARSTQQLCEIIDLVREKHLRLVIIGSITLDCRQGQPDPMSEAFLQMAGVFSQLELAMIRARVRSGMQNARAKGKRIGRPQLAKEDIPAAFLRHYPAYKAGNLNVTELARVCDLSRTTAYKYIGLLER